MRIMLHTVPPWAPSGYGVQARLLAHGLRDLGHDVTFSAYGGFLREDAFEGFPLLSCGGTSKGVGRIAHNYRRCSADVMITVCDLWPLDAREFSGLNVVSWLPVDCAPLGMPDVIQLRAAIAQCESFTPVAMSEHGKRMLEQEERGHLNFKGVPVIPHMLDPVYRTGDRHAWREENGIPAGAFVAGTVGVNGDFPCRKGFPELLAAFQPFSEHHPEARLYMHTQASPGVEGVDLIEIARSLGLHRQVGFPDQLARLADLISAGDMASMYRGLDVLVMPSLGEGFSVPCIEAHACGTPLIVTDGSAIGERFDGRCDWLCTTQPVWSKLHNAWWHAPRVDSLRHALEQSWAARSDGLRRRAAKQAAARYRPEIVMDAWGRLLAELG